MQFFSNKRPFHAILSQPLRMQHFKMPSIIISSQCKATSWHCLAGCSDDGAGSSNSRSLTCFYSVQPTSQAWCKEHGCL